MMVLVNDDDDDDDGGGGDDDKRSNLLATVLKHVIPSHAVETVLSLLFLIHHLVRHDNHSLHKLYLQNLHQHPDHPDPVDEEWCARVARSRVSHSRQTPRLPRSLLGANFFFMEYHLHHHLR